jgi:hypothetical protein
MVDEIEYRTGSHLDWNLLASQTATVELRPSENEPTAIVVTGSCPRCGHASAHIEPIVVWSQVNPHMPVDSARAMALRSALNRVGARSKNRNVEVICGCGSHHPGAPDGKQGCGASWVLHVEWGSE